MKYYPARPRGGRRGYPGRVLICAGDVMAGSEHPVHGGISTARDQDPPTRRPTASFCFLVSETLLDPQTPSSSSTSSGSRCSGRFRRFVQQASFVLFLSFFFPPSSYSFLSISIDGESCKPIFVPR